MKIKNFLSFTCAKQYFNECIREGHEPLMIEDHVEDNYRVIDRDMYNRLRYKLKVKMTLHYTTHW